MQSIEEITAGIAAALTTLAAVIAAALRIKKGVAAVIEDPDEESVDKAVVKELSEIKAVMAQIRADMETKCAVNDVKLDHLERDVAVLFEKTDKLTDILIDHFSR